jgi:hypothetical protein
MTDLNLVIDVMLPGDPELRMPSASVIDFDNYVKRHHLEELINDFLSMLEQTCIDKFNQLFSALDLVHRLDAINACKLKNIRVFSAMVSHLLKAYYTSPEVLRKISAGSVPPFPKGNSIDQDDWSLLEAVYERGQMFRDVS